MTGSLFDARFLPQLMAAISRHEECENWATWGNVIIARDAVAGDQFAQDVLSSDSCWQLTAEGLLPVTEAETHG